MSGTAICRIDFEPSEGKELAYPDKNQVIILNVSDWSEKATLICNEVSAPYSIVQYSPCGKFIIATSLEGDFVVWEVGTQEVANVSKHTKSIAICGLMWNPKGNGEIVYTDVEGQLGIITESVKGMTNDGPEQMNTDEMELADNDVDFTGVNFEEDNDEDNENAVSLEQLKKQYNLGEPDDELQKLETASSRSPTPRPRTPQVPLQPSFMPSSTPEHLDPRYLCWNDVGVIRCYGNNSDESTSKSIEVEFHDTTFHSSMMMQNYQDYTLGSISKSALVVANSSQINVIPLAASSKEWSLKVEENEEITLVAASENLICFAMANYIIRVALVYGSQRGVISVPGPIVSMASFKNFLMVAYHTSGKLNSPDLQPIIIVLTYFFLNAIFIGFFILNNITPGINCI
ncbi:unnamed protein product [Phaedon cochleariae]|uniref:Uncharacterized protein n=1 Tax=Phaedon cochleariae TaxID=80249 RepID=A0A9N9SGM5_PHACE|nr:unnamed protein product [Phaedon cochleariae]